VLLGGHVQGLKYQLGAWVRSHGPADDSPTGQSAYWTIRLLDDPLTGRSAYWTIRLLDDPLTEGVEHD